MQKDPWLALKILHSCPCRAVALNQGGFAVHGHLVPGGRPLGLHNLRCSWHLAGRGQGCFSTPSNALGSPSNSQTPAAWQRDFLTGMDMTSMRCIVKNWNRQMLPCYTLIHSYLFIYLCIYLYVFEHTNISRTVVFENHEKSFLLLFRFSSAHFFSKMYMLFKNINILEGK